MKTYIVDSDALPNPDYIVEVLKAIFAVNDLAVLPRELVSSAVDSNSASVSELVSFCYNKSFELPASNSNELAVRNGLLATILNFNCNQSRNAESYDTGSKSNPDAVWWPNPDRGQSIYESDFLAKTIDLIDLDTPVGSAGSCFAMEIANRMQRKGFNYIVTEPNLHSERGTHISCARWGAIFNPPAFRQLIERSFGLSVLPKYIWRIQKKSGEIVFRDPFREEVEFSSVGEYEESLSNHIIAAKEALLKVKVFIITLGLNEVWNFRADGSILSRTPWRVASAYTEYRVLDVEEAVSELQRMLDIWRKFNPELKLIISVSPVPMIATTRGSDMHVAAATGQSKATLRLAAQKFCDANKDVYYFPAFEKIMYGTQSPWEKDQRHVTADAVDGVMRMFERSFAPKATLPKNRCKKAFIELIGRANEYDGFLNTLEKISLHWSSPEQRHLKQECDTFYKGYKEYALTGKTPHPAYVAMRNLFVATNGGFSRLMSEIIQKSVPPSVSNECQTLFGDCLDKAIAGIKDKGCWVFQHKVSECVVENILNFALKAEAQGRPTKTSPAVNSVYKDMRTNGNGLFQFSEEKLIQNEDIWKLACDQNIIDLARAYLGCEPILDMVTMWWSFPTANTEDEKNVTAQLYHFDNDRLSFLKIFIYLTDVDDFNGPHSFVEGSHKGFSSRHFCRDGRFSDEEVRLAYPREELVIKGGRGTIFAVDTKGLHKGVPLINGERLVFQLEFANSLFGAPYDVSKHERLMNQVELKNPLVFSKFKYLQKNNTFPFPSPPVLASQTVTVEVDRI